MHEIDCPLCKWTMIANDKSFSVLLLASHLTAIHGKETARAELTKILDEDTVKELFERVYI